MRDTIDLALSEQIAAAGSSPVEAIVLVSPPRGAGASSDPRGAGGPLLDRLSQRLNESPIEVQFLPKLGGFYVKGSTRFLSELLEDDDVTSASAADATMTLL